jgi:hypothetical protein
MNLGLTQNIFVMQQLSSQLGSSFLSMTDFINKRSLRYYAKIKLYKFNLESLAKSSLHIRIVQVLFTQIRKEQQETNYPKFLSRFTKVAELGTYRSHSVFIRKVSPYSEMIR